MSGLSEPAAQWRRGSACLPSECVEVAAISGYVLIRDSADKADGPVLIFSRERWCAFTGLFQGRDAPGGKRDVSLIGVRPVQRNDRLNYRGKIAGKSSEAVTA